MLRGETFRKLLLKIGEVRSLLPERVNIMALTATATTKLRINISRVIGMQNELVISRSPCKDNIMYEVADFATVEETFMPFATKLKDEGKNFLA